jgi:isoleucyl-tRNA synthetase
VDHSGQPGHCPASRFRYAAVETGDGQVLILARDLVDDCMQIFGIRDYRILAEMAALLEKSVAATLSTIAIR